MLQRSFTLVIIILSVAFFSCRSKSPTGSSAVNPAAIIGSWNSIEYMESWDFVEDGEADKGTTSDAVNDTSSLVIIDESNIHFYSNDDDCYDVMSESYTLSGNRILGESFNGEETDEDGTWSWNTTVSQNGNRLIITLTETAQGATTSGWYKTTITMLRYAGAVPPENWPAEQCNYELWKKKAKDPWRFHLK